MKDYEYRSDEETYFSWYLKELEKHGYITDVRYEEESFDLTSAVRVDWQVQMKTKVKTDSMHLMAGCSYTPDFTFRWTDKADGIFIQDQKPCVERPPFAIKRDCLVDVKGNSKGKGSKNSSQYTFPFAQKLTWLIHQIYVQKVIPQKIFADTFTPARYLFTDKAKQTRKIKFKVRTLEEFVQLRTFEGKTEDGQLGLL